MGNAKLCGVLVPRSWKALGSSGVTVLPWTCRCSHLLHFPEVTRKTQKQNSGEQLPGSICVLQPKF